VAAAGLVRQHGVELALDEQHHVGTGQRVGVEQRRVAAFHENNLAIVSAAQLGIRPAHLDVTQLAVDVARDQHATRQPDLARPARFGVGFGWQPPGRQLVEALGGDIAHLERAQALVVKAATFAQLATHRISVRRPQRRHGLGHQLLAGLTPARQVDLGHRICVRLRRPGRQRWRLIVAEQRSGLFKTDAVPFLDVTDGVLPSIPALSAPPPALLRLHSKAVAATTKRTLAGVLASGGRGDLDQLDVAADKRE